MVNDQFRWPMFLPLVIPSLASKLQVRDVTVEKDPSAVVLEGIIFESFIDETCVLVLVK